MDGTFREAPDKKEVEKYEVVVTYKDMEFDKFIDVVRYEINNDVLVINRQQSCICVNMDSVRLFYIEKQK